MAYILGLIVVWFFFLALHYFTELTKTQKIATTAITFIVIAGAIAFNHYSTAKSDKMMQVISKFKQNRTISCNGIDVNSSFFTLSVGTFTFIGKVNTPNYTQMISASNCE